MAERITHQTIDHEPTKLGKALTIVGEPFGKSVNNEELLNIAIRLGLPSTEIENAQKAIAITGFTKRYFSHLPDEEQDINSGIERTVGIGARLLREVMTAHGWEDGIDVFIDTSAFLPSTINEEILIAADLNPHNILSKSYRYACAGAVGAFIDCLSDTSLKNARIVIAALEPLSLILDRSLLISPKTITIPSIFGDANTLMAFSPKDFNLNVKQILVQPDAGVIRLNTIYDFDKTPSNPASTPSHYRFANGGESIFHHSKTGAYLRIEKPPTDSQISMDGMATGFFFGDQTANVIAELLEENGSPNLLKQLDGKNMIMHPASKPVVDRIAKLLRRHERHYLDNPDLPFLMDRAGQSNGSSATTLNRWRYMIMHDMIDPRLPTFWIAPGIGSAIAGAIGSINI